MTAQSVNIQYWNGSSYQTISSLVYPGSDVSSSSASFPTITTSQLRFLMPAGQGNPRYPSVFWITELDYGLDLVAPTSAPMFVMVAFPVVLNVLHPGPKYSMILFVPPLTVS